MRPAERSPHGRSEERNIIAVGIQRMRGAEGARDAVDEVREVVAEVGFSDGALVVVGDAAVEISVSTTELVTKLRLGMTYGTLCSLSNTETTLGTTGAGG